MDDGEDLCEISSTHNAALRRLLRLLSDDANGSPDVGQSFSQSSGFKIFLGLLAFTLFLFLLYRTRGDPESVKHSRNHEGPRDPPAGGIF